jgi:hypothetical protein
MGFQRAWDPDGWQGFAFQLVQLRHKPQNVQIVPDAVRGDAGIEFFTTDGCLYQCYAPEEVTDVRKAASAMKEKGRRDLNKLVKFQAIIQRILQGLITERWILLCPFLDDKEVVAYIRGHGAIIKAHGLSFLADNFEALVQSLDDFITEQGLLRNQSLGVPIRIEPLRTKRSIREPKVKSTIGLLRNYPAPFRMRCPRLLKLGYASTFVLI